MVLKKGNLVKVLTGKDKNKSGEIIEIINRLDKAKVKGINIVKKHLKTTKEKKGGIISKENFIHLSNLMIVESNKGKTKTKKVKQGFYQKIQPFCLYRFHCSQRTRRKKPGNFVTH